jgi:hypothetical protein
MANISQRVETIRGIHHLDFSRRLTTAVADNHMEGVGHSSQKVGTIRGHSSLGLLRASDYGHGRLHQRATQTPLCRPKSLT